MSRPAKILFVSLKFERAGGLEIYNLDVAKSLVSLGMDVEAVSVLGSGSTDCEGIPVTGLLPDSGPLSFLRRRFWRHSLKRYLRKTVAKWDLVIAGHILVMPEAAQFANERGVPSWLIVFGIDAWNDWNAATSRAVNSSSVVVSLSTYTADRVREKLTGPKPPPVEVVHPMVDAELFVPEGNAAPSDGLTILTVARLSAAERYKGHDLIISAMPELLGQLDEPVHYWILGDGDDRPRLEKLAHDLDVRKNVHFLGAMWGDERIDYYRGCDVFAMPSKVVQRPDGTWTGEGFGIVYIEAAACGKPVVAVNQGGCVDAVQDGRTGFLVDPDTKAAYNALYKLLEDSCLRGEMGSRGREFVLENFTEDVFTERFREILDGHSD